MKKITSFFLISFSPALLAFAPKSSFPELEKIAKPTSLKNIEVHKLDDSINKSNKAAVYFTYSQTGFEQNGSGQKYDTENGTGKGIYAFYEHSLVSGNEVNFKTWINQAVFKEPSNIGGDEISVRRFLLSGAYSWIWKKEKSRLQLDGGITSLSQNPDSFSSGEKLVPQYLSVGPSIGGGYRYLLSQNWRFSTGIMATMPLFFKEYGSNSGYHDLSLHYIGNLLLDYKLNTSLSFSFGVIAEGENHKFTGDGERGINNADVSYVSFAFPMGVNYAF